MSALHPGMGVILRRFNMNDGDVVRALKAGELASPHRFVNSWYFRIRISGVGLSFRPALKEHVWRQPAVYLNEDFLERAAGLPVIWLHPDKQVLDSQEYAKRTVGTIVGLAYIAGEDGIEDEENGDEVWGIARILDEDAARQMREKRLSTSPAVLLTPGGSERQEMPGGDQHLLVEGPVTLLDHVAICESGVWDKAGPPSGIDNGDGASAGNGRNDDAGVPGNKSEGDMAEETKKEEQEKEKEHEVEAREDAKVAGEQLDKILKGIDSLTRRMDAYDAERARHRRDDDDDDDDRRRDDGEAEADLEESQAKRLEQLAEEEREEGEKEEGKADRRRGDRRMPKRDDRRMRRDVSEDEDEDERDADDRDHEGHEEDKKDSRRMKRDDDDDDHHRDDDDDDDDDDDHRDDDGDDRRMRHDRRHMKRDDRRMPRHDARADAIVGLKRQLEKQDRVITELSRALNRPIEEQAQFSTIQAKADSVYQMHGLRAPPNLTGETATAYELRLARELQKHSPTWKDSNLGLIATADAMAFQNAVKAIYADATTAAKAGTNTPGLLRSETSEDPNMPGMRIRRYYGDPNAWMNSFKAPYQVATRFGDRGERRS